jgi:hypothetical protein
MLDQIQNGLRAFRSDGLGSGPRSPGAVSRRNSRVRIIDPWCCKRFGPQRARYAGKHQRQPPIDVLFDTGAGALLSTNLARRLGLTLEGNSSLFGFGSGRRPGTIARVDSLTIGGLTLHDVYFVVVDPPIAGSDEFAILGAPIVQEMVVQVDYVLFRRYEDHFR